MIRIDGDEAKIAGSIECLIAEYATLHSGIMAAVMTTGVDEVTAVRALSGIALAAINNHNNYEMLQQSTLPYADMILNAVYEPIEGRKSKWQ